MKGTCRVRPEERGTTRAPASAPSSGRRRSVLGAATFVALIASASASACSTKSADSTPTNDAGVDSGPPREVLVARGKYLVDTVAGCPDCHTPRVAGILDKGNYLAGGECFHDSDVDTPGVGCLSSANLTNDETGLKNRTDDEIKNMFLNGIRPDGKFLPPVMPYWVFHNMTEEDANSIVAYLRTVPAIAHRLPPNEAPWPDLTLKHIDPLDPATFPKSDGSPSAERGRYLATSVGLCVDCHTPSMPGTLQPDLPPLNMVRVFSGGRPVADDVLRGLPMGVFPPRIYVANITSDGSGLKGWTAPDIVRVLKEGKDKMGDGICPTMPGGAKQSLGGLTDDDATDIANYIVTLPPIANKVPNDCKVKAAP